jgi:hypothetical protein
METMGGSTLPTEKKQKGQQAFVKGVPCEFMALTAAACQVLSCYELLNPQGNQIHLHMGYNRI